MRTHGLILALLLLAPCAYAQVPTVLQELTDSEWQANLPARTTFWTAEGDSALVLTDDNRWIRARVGEETYVHCPSIGATIFSLSDLIQSADSVLFEGGETGMDGTLMLRVECVTAFAEINQQIP